MSMIGNLIEKLEMLKKRFIRDQYKEFANIMDDAIDTIQALSAKLSAHNLRNGWIPCSERLPEDRRTVLVTAYWHEKYQVMMGCYYGDGLWWCVPYNNCGEHWQKLKPKAWKELPEPYNGD